MQSPFFYSTRQFANTNDAKNYITKLGLDTKSQHMMGATKIAFNTIIIALTSTRCRHLDLKVRKNANIRNPYNQIPHLSQDTIWKSDKNTINHPIQESQEVSSFPAGDHKATRNRQEIMTRNTNSKKGSSKEAPPWNGQ